MKTVVVNVDYYVHQQGYPLVVPENTHCDFETYTLSTIWNAHPVISHAANNIERKANLVYDNLLAWSLDEIVNKENIDQLPASVVKVNSAVPYSPRIYVDFPTANGSPAWFVEWFTIMNLELVTPLTSTSTQTCPDCKGKGKYVGLSLITQCKKCNGTGVC